MEQDINNHLEGSNIGEYIGGNTTKNVYNIVSYQDKEREFIVTHNVNIKPVSYFTGRELELKELSKRIEEGRKAVLVSGMGGIGKTNICKKLFEKYTDRNIAYENRPFHYVGYIEYNENMDNSLLNCLKYKKQDNPEMNKKAAWKELEYLASDGKLLLFVDNVNVSISEDPSLQQLKKLPGAIILTSRRTAFSKEFEPFRIGFLSTEQCREIYEKIRFEGSKKKVNEEEEPHLNYIIEKLAARHTITVEFLAHLAQTKHWSVEQLRKELEQNGFQLEYKDEEDELINIQQSYETLYDLSKLTEAEQNILEAFSVFPYLPLAVKVCNQWLLSDAGVEEKEDILEGLYRKGWLQFDIEQESYSLHPVFATFIYEKCKPTMEKHVGLMKACQESLEIPEGGSALECQNYVLFAESIIEKIDMRQSIEKAEFMFKFAYLLEYIADYKKAEKLYEQSFKIFKQELGENHSDTAISYNNLAGVYARQGKYKEAESLYKKGLEIREKILGENHPDTATSYNNLGLLYERQGKYKEAESLYKKGLEIREKILGENHPDTAISYNNLAGVYESQGKYKEAESLYKKGLEIREKILGENHPDTAISYNNLAGVYESQGKYKEAESLYKKGLEIREKILGENHPDTAISYNNLAGVYESQGKYKEAESLYKKGLEIREKILGENHPDTAISYNNLAGVYESQGKYKEAESLYKKGLEIREKILGENHSDTAASYNNLGLLYASQGKYKEAESLYKKGLEIREKILGENHPDTATSYNNLGLLYERQGKYKEAESLYKKGLEIREKILGENHPDTATSYNNLAGVYASQEKYKMALVYYLKAYKIFVFKLGLQHPNTQIVYENMKIAYFKWNPEGNFNQ